MPYIKSSKTVPFPIKDIYEAFADVESYPKILGYIHSAEIIERDGDIIIVEVKLGVSIFTISYRCKVQFNRYKTIIIDAISGPFKYLKSSLVFTSLDPEKTRINYKLDSEFRSQTMEAAAGLLFTRQFNASLGSFERYMRRKKR